MRRFVLSMLVLSVVFIGAPFVMQAKADVTTTDKTVSADTKVPTPVKKKVKKAKKTIPPAHPAGNALGLKK